MVQSETHRWQGKPVAHIRSKNARPDRASLEIVLFEDSSAMCVSVDDVVEWYPSLGVLLAAHDLEWRDVELAPPTPKNRN